MDLINNRACVLNACIGGGWYAKGSERLKRSLIQHGWAGDILLYLNKWPNNHLPDDCPYNIKASALLEAVKEGYSHILWCDSSVWALQDPMPIFDIINEQGYFFWKSGYNCAQTCNDRILDYAGLSRDKAETFDDVSTSIFGFNVNNPQGQDFFLDFIKYCKDQMFNGSRLHDNQSLDPRFLFHRQDQSAASLIVGKMGLKISNPNTLCAYYQKELPESVILTLRGM